MQSEIQISSIATKHSDLDCAIIKGGQKAFVLLPGLYTKSLMPLAPAVARQYSRFLEEYTIYMLDRVSNPPENYMICEMVDDTIRAIGALGVCDACMMGVSAGGVVAQLIAEKRQDIVKRLVIGSSTANMTEHAREVLRNWGTLAREGKISELNRAFASSVYTASFYQKNEDAILSSLADVSDADLKRFAVFTDCLCRFDALDSRSRIACPVLAIGGAEDQVFGAEQTKEIARRTGGQFFIYEHYGHAVYDEAPDYLERVLEFF